MKTNTMKNKIAGKGFTLVELLVVVAIIAILATIGLTVFSGAQANARDARRKSDIDAIANALESQRTPGAAYYVSLPVAAFSSNAVPVDSTTAQYSIRTTITSTAPVPVDPTAWAAASAVPTAPAAAAGESAWTAIPSTGLAVGTGTAPFVANTVGWKVCARLETGAFYCKPSAQ